MPAEQLGEEPRRLLVRGPFRRVGRDDVGAGQARDECLGPRLCFGQVGRELSGPFDRPWDLQSGRRAELDPEVFEPVPQPQVADHVIAVVALDALELVGLGSLDVAELEPLLEGHDARARVAQVDLPYEAVERLHLLDRIALDRRAQRLADDAQQVDQDPLAQELVDLCLARPVAPHQALQGGRLVRRVVVDVEVRVAFEALHEEVHQALEGAPLAVERELVGLVARPDRGELVVDVEDPEEVVEAVVERVRIALDVEEEIAGRGRRERGEPAIELDRRVGGRDEQLVRQSILAPALELDPRLLTDPYQCRGADVLEWRFHRQRQVAERFEGRDATLDQRTTLSRGDPGDEAQVIVAAAAGSAFGRPTTDIAVLDGFRVRARRWVGRWRLVGKRPEEAVSCAAVVGHEVVDPEPLHRPGAAAERDVQPLGTDILDPLELVDVRADLEDGARLDVAGELRIGDLVVVRAPARRPLGRVHPQQEVGMPAEGAVEEGRLIDHVGAGGHRLDGHGGRGTESLAAIRRRPVGRDLDHVAARRAQIGEEPRLMLEAAATDDVELRVGAHRPTDEAGQRRALELGQMLTGEIGDEVRGRIDRPAVDTIHAPKPYQRNVPARLSRRSASIRP